MFKLNLFDPIVIIVLESVLLTGFLVIRFLVLPRIEGWTFFQFENGKRYRGLKETIFLLFTIFMVLLLLMPIVLYGLDSGYEKEVTLFFDIAFILIAVFVTLFVVLVILGMKYQEEGQPILFEKIPYYRKLSLIFCISGVILVVLVLGFTDFSYFERVFAEREICD